MLKDQAVDPAGLRFIKGKTAPRQSAQVTTWHLRDGSARWFVFGLQQDPSGRWAVVGGGGGSDAEVSSDYPWVDFAGCSGSGGTYVGGAVSGPGSEQVAIGRLRVGDDVLATGTVDFSTVVFLGGPSNMLLNDKHVVAELVDTTGHVVVSAHSAADARVRFM